MYAQRRLAECLAYVVRLGQYLQEIATAAVKHVQIAIGAGIYHLDGANSYPIGHFEAPLLAEASGGLGIDGDAAGEVIGHRAYLSATLYTAMPANGNHTAVFFSQPSLRERQIHDSFYRLYAERMLRDTHAPAQYAGAGGMDGLGEALHLREACTT